MAQIYDKANGSALPVAFSRTNPRPLDESSYFASLNDARAYAEAGPSAYVGQLLTVATDAGVDLYKIVDKEGTLEKVPDEARVEELAAQMAAGIRDTGFQGSFYQCITDRTFTFKRGMIFLVDADAITHFLPSASDASAVADGVAVEVGDFLIYKSSTDIPADDLASLMGNEHSGGRHTILQRDFSIWQANLSGAVTAVQDQENPEEYGYISSLVNANGTLRIGRTTLPVHTVRVTGTGNNIVGADFRGGVLSLTYGKVQVPQLSMSSVVLTAENIAENVFTTSQPACGLAKVYLNGVLQPPAAYTCSTNDNYTAVAFADTSALAVGDELVLEWVHMVDPS